MRTRAEKVRDSASCSVFLSQIADTLYLEIRTFLLQTHTAQHQEVINEYIYNKLGWMKGRELSQGKDAFLYLEAEEKGDRLRSYWRIKRESACCFKIECAWQLEFEFALEIWKLEYEGRGPFVQIA